MKTGIKKIAIYDPATGVTVQLNKVAPDGEFNIKAPLAVKDVNGGLYYDGDESFLEMLAYDDTGYDQLIDWMQARTPLRMRALGLDQSIFWDESTPITVKRTSSPAAGSLNAFIVNFARERGTHNIYQSSNFLKTLGRWKDGDSNGKADMLTFNSQGGFSFSNGVQQVDDTGFSSDCIITGEVIFPVSAWRCQFFIPVIVAENPNNFTGTFLNFAGGTISTHSAGSTSFAVTVPASVYKIRWRITIDSSGFGNLTQFGLPYLGPARSSYSSIDF